MKIRQDFVTNSSSSSYTAIISITPVKGKAITHRIDPIDEECGSSSVNYSPSEILKSQSLDELLELLTTDVDFGAGDDYDEDDDYFEEIIQDARDEVDEFKETVKSEIKDLQNISLVEVTSHYQAYGEFADIWDHLNENLVKPEKYKKPDQIKGGSFFLSGDFPCFGGKEKLAAYIREHGGMIMEIPYEANCLLVSEPEDRQLIRTVQGKDVPVLTETEFLSALCDPESLDATVREQITFLTGIDRVPFILATRKGWTPDEVRHYMWAVQDRVGPSFETRDITVMDLKNKKMWDKHNIKIYYSKDERPNKR